MESQTTQDQLTPNADTPPPGSSESFNDFKDRTLSTISDYVKNGQDDNTVLVTHSKPIRIWDAWEHGGYADDIHQRTYDKEECVKPGGHQEISMPAHVSYRSRFEQPRDTFDQRYEGEPGTLPTTFPGEIFQPVEYNTLKDEIVRPKWPGERDIQPIETDADKFNSTLYQPVADLKQQQPLEAGGGAPTNTVIRGPGVPEVKDPYNNKQQIFDLLDKSTPHAEIAEKVGVSRAYVSKLAKDADITSVNSNFVDVEGYPPARKNSTWSDPKANDNLVRLFNLGYSPKEIAEELKITPGQASGRIKRINDYMERNAPVERTIRPVEQSKWSEMTEQERLDYVRNMESGEPASSIARRAGATRDAVMGRWYRLRQQENIPPAKPGTRNIKNSSSISLPKLKSLEKPFEEE